MSFHCSNAFLAKEGFMAIYLIQFQSLSLPCTLVKALSTSTAERYGCLGGKRHRKESCVHPASSKPIPRKIQLQFTRGSSPAANFNDVHHTRLYSLNSCPQGNHHSRSCTVNASIFLPRKPRRQASFIKSKELIRTHPLMLC
jgi:hypothetical protein